MRSEIKLLIVRVFLLLVVLYVFFLSLEMMGDAFKLFGKDIAFQLISSTANPFIGLFIGILVTSIIQSSSTTTSITVGLVAAGGLTIHNAIPIVMGANIGTSVTNIIVSFGSVTRKEEFRRALSGSVVHDFFNVISVLILFPIEIFTGYLQHTAGFLAGMFSDIGGIKFLSPIKAAIKPTSHLLVELLGRNGVVVLVVALVMLFLALKFMVDLLKRIVLSRTEEFLHKYIFRPGITSMLFGMILTAIVQSSSITTSLIVPLVGSGILTVEQIFPYTLGANVGTTFTAVMAALVTANPAALVTAFAHTLFNVTGILIIYPIRAIRNIPIYLAKKLSYLTSISRVYPVLYVLIVFFILPSSMIFISGHHTKIQTHVVTIGIEKNIFTPVAAMMDEIRKKEPLIGMRIKKVNKFSKKMLTKNMYDVFFVEGRADRHPIADGNYACTLVAKGRPIFIFVNDDNVLKTQSKLHYCFISKSLYKVLFCADSPKMLIPNLKFILLPDEQNVIKTVVLNKETIGLIRPWVKVAIMKKSSTNGIPGDGIWMINNIFKKSAKKMIENLRSDNNKKMMKKYGLISMQ